MTLKAHKAAQKIARGATQLEAWRTVTPNWEEMELKAQYEASCRFFAKPQVRSKITEILEKSALAATMSGAEYFADTMAQREWAKARGNENAVMQAQRLMGMTLGHLKEQSNITVEHRSLAEKHVEELKRLGIPADVADALLPRTSFGTKH